MSGELEIRGGGAIAVDTETLRMTAARFVLASATLDDIARRLGSVQYKLIVEHGLVPGAVSAASALSSRLVETTREAREIADKLRHAAAAYELVDLNARHAAAVLAGDETSAAVLHVRRGFLAREYAGTWDAARFSEFERTIMWPSDLVREATDVGMDMGGLLEFLDRAGPVGKRFADVSGVVGGAAAGVGALAAVTVLGGAGWGRIPNDARLRPPKDSVTIRSVTSPGVAEPPTGLAGAAARVPTGDSARVRVEKYVLPDGSRQFAVYVAGTRSTSLGGAEAWDAASNADLYTGRESASYRATIEALEEAGARPGDVVHAVGHSQGAMIASHLAVGSEFDVQTLVSLGSPVEADVGDSTLAVTVRHTDDPVAALAGGGYGGGVGAPGSILVERSTHDPTVEGGPSAHALVSYLETAQLVDGSGDPRVELLDAVFDELSTATSVEVTEYGATRVSPSTSAGVAAGSRRPS